MNIRHHQQAFLGFTSWHAIRTAMARPDATRVKVRDATVIRWAGRVGAVFGWVLVIVAGMLVGVAAGRFTLWAVS